MNGIRQGADDEEIGMRNTEGRMGAEREGCLCVGRWGERGKGGGKRRSAMDLDEWVGGWMRWMDE